MQSSNRGVMAPMLIIDNINSTESRRSLQNSLISDNNDESDPILDDTNLDYSTTLLDVRQRPEIQQISRRDQEIIRRQIIQR